MRLATIQFESIPDVDANLDKAEVRLREAAANDIDLAILPEIWNVGYFNFELYEKYAESIEGNTMTRLQSLAAELDIYLHTGSVVEAENDNLYNTSALIAPDGELLDKYRKIHLFGYESKERELLTAGERIVSIELEFGTVGLTTCFDLRFPEQYRALVDQGVELLLVTSAWPRTRAQHWQLLNQVRALESQTFLAAANLSGTCGGVKLAGQSAIVDPRGVPLVNAGSGERNAFADICIEDVSTIREEFPTTKSREIELSYSI